jgi:hypothetical protein
LKWDDELGSFEKGKMPGVVLMDEGLDFQKGCYRLCPLCIHCVLCGAFFHHEEHHEYTKDKRVIRKNANILLINPTLPVISAANV